MTTTVPSPPASQMAHDPEPRPTGRQPDEPPAAGSAPASQPPRPERFRRDAAVTNTILSILGAAFVAVLSFALVSSNSRITRLEDRMDAGFARVDARFAAQDKKVTELFAAQDDKIDGLGDKIDMIDLKLTALIAALNKTNEVGAALDGRLLNSDASTAALGGQPAS